MAISFRCLKCSKIIECQQYDRTVLFEHIRTDHPEVELQDNETMEYPQKENPPPNNNYPTEEIIGFKDKILPDIDLHMEETTIRSPDLKPINTRKYKITTPLTPRSPQRRRMYKTSIEKWRPAKGLIYCPKCGANKKPLIKSKTEKLSYSTVGAACILACWPLCFWPHLFQSPPRDYLHCAECRNFLGMYDKQRNCIRPNRVFIEDGGCQKETIQNSTENNRHRREFKVHSHQERKSV